MEVKWIKLSTDIFNNRKIRQIECLPDGYAIIVVWVKLLCLAGTVNDQGLVYLTRDIPYTDQTLAQEFGMSLTTVQAALATFQQFGMVEIVNDFLLISNWEKYQNLDKMTEIREYNKIAQRKHREKLKEAVDTNGAANLPQKAVIDMSLTSQLCHETDIEEDIEEDIITNRNNIYTAVVEHLNSVCGTKYKASSKETRRYIDARLNNGFAIDDFKRVIDTKAAEWLGDQKMRKYLRPETLFGTKFESYLNEGRMKDGSARTAPATYGTVL